MVLENAKGQSFAGLELSQCYRMTYAGGLWYIDVLYLIEKTPILFDNSVFY